VFRNHDDHWQHHWLGRQGDGHAGWTGVDQRGRLHAVFEQDRLTEHARLLTFVWVDDETHPFVPGPATGQVREIIDNRPTTRLMGATIDDHDDHDEPAVLLSRVRRDRVDDLSIARRNDGRWEIETICSDSMGLRVSNLLCDRSGQLVFAWLRLHHDEAILEIVREHEEGWSVEAIATVDAVRIRDSGYDIGGQVILRYDSQGRLVAVVVEADVTTLQIWRMD